jgi:hypothetical protein
LIESKVSHEDEYLTIHPVGDSAVGYSADHRPLVKLFFHFFSAETNKKEVALSRIGFENRFLDMIAIPSPIS